MISPSDLKAYIILCKEEKIKKLKLGDIEIEPFFEEDRVVYVDTVDEKVKRLLEPIDDDTLLDNPYHGLDEALEDFKETN